MTKRTSDLGESIKRNCHTCRVVACVRPVNRSRQRVSHKLVYGFLCDFYCSIFDNTQRLEREPEARVSVSKSISVASQQPVISFTLISLLVLPSQIYTLNGS